MYEYESYQESRSKIFNNKNNLYALIGIIIWMIMVSGTLVSEALVKRESYILPNGFIINGEPNFVLITLTHLEVLVKMVIMIL